MSNIIKHIRIDKLFGTTNIDWELNPSVNVLVGQNGLGKSTILQVIKSVLIQDICSELQLCGHVKVNFTNQQFTSINFDITSFSLLDVSDVDFLNSIERMFDEVVSKVDVQDILKSINLSLLLEKAPNLNVIKELPIKFESSDVLDETPIEFISTINMSANSINNLTTSSGQNTTLLDIEIKNEIQRLLVFNDEKLIDNLLTALNSLFSETKKVACFEKNELIITLSNGKQIDFDKLSSGERQVIFIFLKVVNASVDGALILMDEPEISLHLSWQEKLLNEIRRVNDKSQIIIVTHSPAMLMNGWMDSFVDIKNIMTEVEEDTEDNSDSSLTDNSLNDSSLNDSNA